MLTVGMELLSALELVRDRGNETDSSGNIVCRFNVEEWQKIIDAINWAKP